MDENQNEKIWHQSAKHNEIGQIALETISIVVKLVRLKWHTTYGHMRPTRRHTEAQDLYNGGVWVLSERTHHWTNAFK